MSRKKYFLLLFLTSLTIYCLTLAPSLATANGAYWVVNSLMAGLAHAPGEILYLMVSSCWSHLYQLIAPLLRLAESWLGALLNLPLFTEFEPASGVTLVSAVSAALSLGLVFLILDRLLSHLGALKKLTVNLSLRWVLAAGILYLAALPTVWSSAVIAGPAAFNLLLILILLWMLLRIEEGSPHSGALALGWAYLAGLSFSQSYVFIFSIAILALFLYNGKKVARVFRAGPAGVLLVFLLGLTAYFYIWVKPLTDPGLGSPVPMFSRAFWDYFLNLDGLRGSFSRNAPFFSGQVALFLGYLKWQSGSQLLFIVCLVLFHFGMVRLIKAERRLGVSGLVLLAFSLLAVLWLYNPKLGLEQAWDKFPNPARHEASHIDSLFLFPILLFGCFTVAGVIFLKSDVEKLLKRLAAKVEFLSGGIGKVIGYSLIFLLLASLLASVPLKWRMADMSKYFVERDLAANTLAGVEPDGILILTDDREYYPALYARAYLLPQSKQSLVNYERLSDKEYLKNLKNANPPVQLGYDDRALDRLGPVKLEKSETFQAGNLKVNYPANTVFLVRDMALMDLLHANGFAKPVYFSYFLGAGNMLGLEKYVAIRGLMVRLFDTDPQTGADSLDFYRKDDKSRMIDVNWSSQLLWGYYRYHTNIEQIHGKRQDLTRPLLVYARLHAALGEAFLSRKDVEAASNNFRQCEFFDPAYSNLLMSFASRLASAKAYDKSKEFAASYFKNQPADPLKWAGLAKVALENRDSIPATEMLLESVKADPDFLLGYQKIIRVYASLGRHEMVSAMMSRWLTRHPNDQETRRLWDQYSTTHTLPPNFPD
ncbi:MAG: hypothetical protein A3F83_03200 [Candidatus Glassbacteria bacterium RIFCSPLOWO2_12_FULL_58_11]|uniref:Uncharacterized protein n=1 Tax=Candidatus Glassbacteria bacterium RIFCSPLOWO2_12_FULL_58_11 TaxID=1817867 RepID=A0A1F5YZ10_9BACT|nr:MAG: hypothetical protein A3F83_03200 [Candidatus Glassbacteria bacterium RIFCSPLOWO2_12_FULL_58_11]